MYIVSLELKRKCPSTVSPKEHLEPSCVRLTQEMSLASALALLDLIEKIFGLIETDSQVDTSKSSTKP